VLFEKKPITHQSLKLTFEKPIKKEWNHFTVSWKKLRKERSDTVNNLKSIHLPKSMKEEMTLRFPLTGDIIQPKGMNGRKKLSDVFIDKKLPLPLRKITPVLIFQNEVVWIWDMMISEKLKHLAKEDEKWELNMEIMDSRS
jgi:tRNA(Ile)-lysidine synthetase-like protein